MSLSINTNLNSLEALQNLLTSGNDLATSVRRLSSGLRVETSADDPAGFVITQDMQARVAGIGQAIQNSQDAINLVKTANGAMDQIESILQTMRVAAVQASNTGTEDNGQLQATQSQIQSSVQAIGQIASNTQWNGVPLLNGQASNLLVQVGPNASQTGSISLPSAEPSQLGINAIPNQSLATIDVTQTGGPQQAIQIVDDAITQLSAAQGAVGAFQSDFLQATVSSLGVATENLTASVSDIRDADVAAEMTNFTRAQLLQQSGIAMLAQANQQPAQILKLLG